MSEGHLEEFLTIVTRDLGAASALILDATDELHDAGLGSELALSADLPGGRRLVVRFAEPPADVDAIRRRLSMLASAFGDVLPHDRPRPSRPPPARSLREELAALVKRAAALDAVIIDGHSPVTWGAASDPEVLAWQEENQPPPARPSGLHLPDVIPLHAGDWGNEKGGAPPPLDPPPTPEASAPAELEEPEVEAPELEEDQEDERERTATGLKPPQPEAPAQPSRTAMLTVRAMNEVRALPDLAGLKRGGHLRHSVSEPGFGYVARSFAAIYVLVVVYDRPFEELLVKRAIAQALPTIERLVAALPPLDPRPTAGVAALRRPRRRR